MVGLGAILGLAGIAGTVIFGHTVLLWVYRPIYAEHTQTLLLLMLCATITYVAGFLSGGHDGRPIVSGTTARADRFDTSDTGRLPMGQFRRWG